MADVGSSKTDIGDINLTSDEAFRLKNAFKNEEFVKLFQDYVEEINSDESRKEYESEIISLEKERGFDVKFLHPEFCYVMKFVQDGKKTFVNVCKNKCVDEATAERVNSGTNWKIPITLSKPREDLDKKNSKCMVIDVMFHPTTLDRAAKDKRLKGIVEDTAISTIKEKFNIYLDAENVKYPKLRYKGKPPKVVLRKSKNNETQECEPIEEYWKKTMESELSKVNSSPKKSNHEVPKTTLRQPKYSVKYRNIIDMQDFSLMGYTDKCAPNEIVVEIQLPEVKSAKEVDLEIFERRLCLKSHPGFGHNYNLSLDLSYAVNKDCGKAQFNTSIHILNVQLPLKDRGIPNPDAAELIQT